MRTQIPFASYISELKILLLLALPIIANGLLETSYGFINTFLVAHLGEKELAAAGLVSMLFITLMVIVWGIMSGISILIANYHGARDIPAIRAIMRDSLILSLLLSIPAMLLLWYAPFIFKWTGQPLFIITESTRYLHALTWAIPFDLPSLVLMQLFQGISQPRINLIFTLIYMPFLIAINYIFMFGKFGFPAMGLAGIGWGTVTAYIFYSGIMLLFLYCSKHYKDYINFKLASPKNYLKEILRVGLPLGFMYSVEVGYFFILAVLFGKMGISVLGAHQIIIQYFWVVMTATFSLAQALSIRISFRLGEGKPAWIFPIAQLGQFLALIYGLLIALIYWFFPHYLIKLDFIGVKHIDPQLVSMAVLLFFYAAFFQIIDGVRIIMFSILRGLKDTRFTLITSVLTFWGIALPIGYYLGFVYKHHNYPQGLWIGLIISAAAGSIILWRRLMHKLGRYCH